jgi:hypothetical protein
MNNQIDPAFFNFVAQTAHFSATYALTLTAMLFTRLQQKHRWAVVFGLIVAYACFHEFFYDPRYENAVTRGSDVEDWCFLVLGSVVAEVAAKLKFHYPMTRYGGTNLN